MSKFIIGKKLGMTELTDEEGRRQAVTVIQAEPVSVLEVLTTEKHGYKAVKVGYGTKKQGKATRPESGYFERLNKPVAKMVKEFRGDYTDFIGEKPSITVEDFTEGDVVDVRGRSMGRGFAGTIKRHNCRRGPMTHGSKSHRITGSIGGGTSPGKVFKGIKMPGHYGNVNVTIKNLKIAKVYGDKNLILVSGSIPGKRNSIVTIVSKG